MVKTKDRLSKMRLEAVETIVEAYLHRCDLEKLQKQSHRYKESGEIRELYDKDHELEGERTSVSKDVQDKLSKLQSSIEKLNSLPSIHLSEFSRLNTAKNVADLEGYLDDVVKYIEENRKQWMNVTSSEGFREMMLRKDVDLEKDSEMQDQEDEHISMEKVLSRADQVEKRFNLLVELLARRKELTTAEARNKETVEVELSRCQTWMDELTPLQDRTRSLHVSHKNDAQQLSRLLQRAHSCGQVQANEQLIKEMVNQGVSKLTERFLESLKAPSGALGDDPLFDEVWQNMIPTLQVIRAVDRWTQMGVAVSNRHGGRL